MGLHLGVQGIDLLPAGQAQGGSPIQEEGDVGAQPRGQGLQAGGTVHHVAFRAPDRETQERWRQELVDEGLSVTPILDRQYFTSIYFREPGGVLFEIATDPPGFAMDEAPDELGTRLMLPPQYEARREDIERRLPPLQVPA